MKPKLTHPEPALEGGAKALKGASKAPKRRDRTSTLEALEKALLRVQKQKERISISSVAREAGVTPALIHNVYPDFAEEIRGLIGKSFRRQRDGLTEQLAKERATARNLRDELKAALSDLAKLASVNARLMDEVAVLRGVAAGKVRIPAFLNT